MSQSIDIFNWVSGIDLYFAQAAMREETTQTALNITLLLKVLLANFLLKSV